MEKVYMTKEGFDRKMEEFNRVKKLLKETSKNKVESAYDGSGDTWHDNFTYEQLDSQEYGLFTRLERLQEEIENIVIIDKEELDDNLVNIGDKVLLEIIYADGECEELVVTLDDSSDDEMAVSLSSPLGKVLYKALVGGKYEYYINEMVNKFIVKRKLGDNDEFRGSI